MRNNSRITHYDAHVMAWAKTQPKSMAVIMRLLLARKRVA